MITSVRPHLRSPLAFHAPIKKMAISAPYFSSAYSSMSYYHSILKKHNVLQFPRISQKPMQFPSLREVCGRGNLQEAFQSFTSLFTYQSYLQLCPDDIYSPVLELCANEKALSQGQQIHAHLMKSCSVFDSVFLGTKLLFMYVKCGSLLNAEKLFDRMCHRTIFTWNAMIGAYVSNGEPVVALELCRKMHSLGVTLDSCTFACILKACATINDLRCGSEIHGLAIKYGCDSIVFVVNSLVAMYAKCGDLDKARKLFDILIQKEDIVSWNSIISAYSGNGQSLEALGLFRELQKMKLPTSTYTFVCALQACENSLFEKLGREIHAAVIKSRYSSDVYVGNALLGMYVRCGKMVAAIGIFNDVEDKDIVSWNTMLSAFVQDGLYNDALQLFYDMQNTDQKPDQVTVLNIIAASGRLGNKLNGMEVHAYAIKNGLNTDLQVGNTLIDMYRRCSCVNFMWCSFHRMPTKDFISWATIIAGYAQNNLFTRALELCRQVLTEGVKIDSMMIESILTACKGLKSAALLKEIHSYTIRRGLYDLVLQNAIVNVYGEFGCIEHASRMFETIESKDVVSWTSMISCYVQNGLANEAFQSFNLMKEANVEPDAVALLSILSAAACLSTLKKGKEIHGFLIRKGFILEGSMANSLVDMYAHCGDLENAHNVYNLIKNKDIILWTAMINAYGMHGHGKKAINLFNRMEDERLIPDHIAFLALLYACSHSGLIGEGKRCFDIMLKEYHLEPWPEHCACLIDLLGRANHLEEAYKFVNSMQCEVTAEVWCALLRACQVHSNKEIGDIAARKLLELDSCNPGNYVLISNVFAASGRWKDVKEVRMRMKECGLKKNPGCSWIEVRNKVHVFMARDRSHPHSDVIYQKLAQITDTLVKKAGYVAQTKLVLHNVEEEEKVEILYGHSERLAIAYGLLGTSNGTPLRITKNLRVCNDCHTFSKLVSKFFERELYVRDANRFHHFKDGVCSCGDFW